MRFGFVTLFPEFIGAAMDTSIVGRAIKAGLISFQCANPRDHATDVHRTVDDGPYGGGPGMVLKPNLVAQAMETLKPADHPVILLDPAAPRFTQKDARRLALEPAITFICGHYEGIDERVRESLCTEVFSVGDFVLTGGELPALCLADAIARLIPGVLGDAQSHEEDSFEDGLLGAPAYTRPPTWNNLEVPATLLGGDHKAIAKWRRLQQLQRTRRYRPDLLTTADLKATDLEML